MGAVKMAISLRKLILPFVLMIALIVALGMLAYKMTLVKRCPSYWMGGAIHVIAVSTKEYAEIPEAELETDRFQRPSSQPALQNPYSFSDFDEGRGNRHLSPNDLRTPENVIMAYYGILREAANMGGYSGGCGTIGYATLPYPYAYELLSNEKKRKCHWISLKRLSWVSGI